MLTELRIRNFAVIEEAALSFGPGLNVLTGETGAGKTIVMSALGLLLGGRASPDVIRTGAKEAVVEGVFELEGEAGLPEAADWLSEDTPRELLIRRVIAEGGRSRVTINDSLATVNALSRIGAALVQIYGQHEQQSLALRENHQQILDRHAGLDAELDAYTSAYEHVREVRERIGDLERRERERTELLEIARFRAAELERAALVAGEDEALAANRAVLANATRLAETANETEQSLYGGESAVIDAIARALARLTEAAAIDPKLGDALEMITSAHANLEEAARTLGAYAAQIEADPKRLEEVDNRLQEVARLKRKYGGTLQSAIETLERSRREITEFEAVGETRTATEAELARALDDLLERARKLHQRRSHDATVLKRRMEAELKTLGMRSAIFEPRLAPIAIDGAAFVHDGIALGPTGFDVVEFYLSPNLGQPPLPLARVASGGELSRVMLALKRLEAQRRGVATIIFDEVDAGIGGAVGEIVGRKLKQLARFHQILCVTHLAQIAAFADRHFAVEKEERRGTTRSRATTLEDADRPAEIARMLGGVETSDKFVRAARELIERASE
ncbi:MAG: repair protein RecN [Candidatus Binataceae bacterium]|jgi:DNA repair protein RecN (Recombination protein N)|nr:repair protein RecN [Candidatus Binataceae bacterium]